jgi:hypothetical protein
MGGDRRDVNSNPWTTAGLTVRQLPLQARCQPHPRWTPLLNQAFPRHGQQLHRVFHHDAYAFAESGEGLLDLVHARGVHQI